MFEGPAWICLTLIIWLLWHLVLFLFVTIILIVFQGVTLHGNYGSKQRAEWNSTFAGCRTRSTTHCQYSQNWYGWNFYPCSVHLCVSTSDFSSCLTGITNIEHAYFVNLWVLIIQRLTFLHPEHLEAYVCGTHNSYISV